MHSLRTHLKNKFQSVLKAFEQGEFILIGDDGKRENEVDLVFHARAATAEKVNFTITHAKGLLCVSTSHKKADALGFYTAPCFPGGMAHTHFTLSVDAQNGITSGISAQDRAHTIQLMAHEQSTFSDFTTPGHVFPVRAVEGGLLERAGHTEAVYELCRLGNLPEAAVMCEVLDDHGAPLTPHKILEDALFSKIPFLTTVEILWYKILFEKENWSKFEEKESVYVLNAKHETHFTLPTAVALYSQQFSPEKLRISMTNSFTHWDNGVSKENACAEITLFSFGNLFEELPAELSSYCDLSAKEGIQSTRVSVRRMVSILRALEFIQQKYEISLNSRQLEQIVFPVKSDTALFLHE